VETDCEIKFSVPQCGRGLPGSSHKREKSRKWEKTLTSPPFHVERALVELFKKKN